MDNESHEPYASETIQGTVAAENPSNPLLTTSENPLDVLTDFEEAEEPERGLNTRHDGWTGQRMAMFCAVLAETGIVTDACIAVGMSTTSAYSARRRNPLFAAAWEESLKLARDRLADALLERSLNGCVEKYYRDGELVGEKRILDNKLGMAILRRLDRMAETGLALHSNLPAALTSARPAVANRRRPGGDAFATGRGAPAPASAKSPDWDLMLSALRSGDEEMMAEAMIELGKAETSRAAGCRGLSEHEVDEVCEVGDPPNRPPSAVNFDEDDDPPERCWWDQEEQCWWTDFPPPPGYAGYERGRWGDEDYKRDCTAEESAALKAAHELALAEVRAEDEAERDAWFAQLKGQAGEDEGREPAESTA